MLCVNAVLQIIFSFVQFVCFIWLQSAAEYPIELPFLSSNIVDHSSVHTVVRGGFLAFKKNNVNTFIQNIILFLFFRVTITLDCLNVLQFLCYIFYGIKNLPYYIAFYVILSLINVTTILIQVTFMHSLRNFVTPYMD